MARASVDLTVIPCTLTVYVTRRLRARLWIALLLIGAAARVMGGVCRVETLDGPEAP